MSGMDDQPKTALQMARDAGDEIVRRASVPYMQGSRAQRDQNAFVTAGLKTMSAWSLLSIAESLASLAETDRIRRRFFDDLGERMAPIREYGRPSPKT